MIMFETNSFFRFIWLFKKASTKLIYFYSNVTAHAIKKAGNVPHHYLGAAP